MALSKEEQKRLADLKAKAAKQNPQTPLSQAEKDELARLAKQESEG